MQEQRYQSANRINLQVAHEPSSTDKDVDINVAVDAERAEKMVEIFLNQKYSSTVAIQRIRLRMIKMIIRNKLQSNLKRFLDIIIVLLAFPLLLIPMIPVVLAIKLDSPGPVFYKQKRVGRWGKPFDCYKFRSMYVDADKRKEILLDQNEADEIVFKMKEDPRVTRVGRIIRKTSIDEIPQLINVLRGEMSLVGPRPAVPEEVENYQFDYLKRLDVTPGITGLQQVSGRSDLEFKKWIELDIQYIEEQSLWKDIVILLETIPTVISGKGAY